MRFNTNGFAQSGMLGIGLALLSPAIVAAAGLPYFSVLSADKGAWPEILSSIGLLSQPASLARVYVARSGASASPEWPARVENGAILILEGESSLAELFGFARTPENARVGSLVDIHNPKLPIVWEKGLELPVTRLPQGARVFAKERWSGAPMVAGFRKGSGAVLWVAAPPGERGYERFPYLLQALCDLGLDAPFRSARLWAFFDYSYRTRVDPDYFATRWNKAGIAALHVAAWHFYEENAERDAYLRRLIESCHRAGIVVYAWLELPHVSEKFWADHPEWREQTGMLQDAHLDWRKLMNLSNRECFRAVSAGVRALTTRFDWDGLNLAELYFESLEGIANQSRFTPMNSDVRRAFRSSHGFDPVELWTSRKDAASQRAFLDYRADLVRRMQEEWIAELDSMRRERPHLDLVLTHVDDRLDAGMKDSIGADAARVLPLLSKYSFTFLVEDPATVWHLGANRYRELAERYKVLTHRREKLAIDLNIVERYQNVYPTKQQTGTELFQLVHEAATSFDRLALYFENSLLTPDLDLLPSAAAAVSRVERIGEKLVVESAGGVGVPWKDGATVDGQVWPVLDGETLWLPAGAHAVEASERQLALRILRFNGAIRGVSVGGDDRVQVSYSSSSRAIAVLSAVPSRIEVDGVEQDPLVAGTETQTVLLPRGQHVVTFFAPVRFLAKRQ